MQYAILAVLFLAMGQNHIAAGSSRYTKRHFIRALREQSTAPIYLLVPLRNKPNASVCVVAPLFISSLRIEHGWGESPRPGVVQFAIDKFDNGFEFNNGVAAQNLEPRYTGHELQRAKELLSKISDGEIRRQLQQEISDVHRFYMSAGEQARRMALQDALAKEILHRGIVVGVKDRTGKLYAP